jgi:8-oxo-dGTP diphosphatase
VLLVDEHRHAHRPGSRHAFAVVDVEKLGFRSVEGRPVFQRIHLCTGLLERDGHILLVANAYPNHAELLWNLPGGRQEGQETCAMAAVRELREETSLEAAVTGLAYVAESFDVATNTQFTAFCFSVEAAGEPHVPPGDAHVRACRWVPRAELASVLAVRVVREPLLHYLADPTQRYFGYLEAGITIAFGDEPE